MTPEEFLERWKLENIDSGTQPSEIEDLSDKLLGDAGKEGIGREILEAAAGGNLRNFITGSTRDSRGGVAVTLLPAAWSYSRDHRFHATRRAGKSCLTFFQGFSVAASRRDNFTVMSPKQIAGLHFCH